MRELGAIILAIASLSLAGCGTTMEQKVATGAAAGAVVGGPVGAAAGAAAGAGVAAGTANYEGCIPSGGTIVVRLNDAAQIRS